MRRLLVLGTALLVFGSASATASAPVRPEHPARLLVAQIPEVGTVYWRTNCRAHDGGPAAALGIRIDPLGQTTEVRLGAGTLTRDRELQPDRPTGWFGCRPARVQWLAAAAAGENGLVLGTVRVDFGPASPELTYSPPRTTVQVFPRRPWGYYGTATVQDLLRRLTR